MKWLAMVAVALVVCIETAIADPIQKTPPGNALLTTCGDMVEDRSTDYIIHQMDQLRCFRYLEGVMDGLAHRASIEGVCLFDVSEVRATETIRQKIVAWMRLNLTLDMLTRSSADVIEQVLKEQYPCK